MAEEAAFFGNNIPPKLKIPFILRTPHMSALHHDTSPDLKVICNTSLKMRRVIVELCDIVATLGARLSAAGTVGILKKLGRDTMKDGPAAKEKFLRTWSLSSPMLDLALGRLFWQHLTPNTSSFWVLIATHPEHRELYASPDPRIHARKSYKLCHPGSVLSNGSHMIECLMVARAESFLAANRHSAPFLVSDSYSGTATYKLLSPESEDKGM
ncbi:Hexokinase [Corchorus olitorius]|uniref:Phosphotransferase n=1 Tax=Corchorus olitorius TaxID=93759 RepID=A0A1R3GJL3_9ROSI|nr:Hexokinase [Corchorus olitorius]